METRKFIQKKLNLLSEAKRSLGDIFQGDQSSYREYLQWKRKNVTLRGIDKNRKEGEFGAAKFGEGLYTAFLSNAKMAREYGDLHFVVNAIPKNPKIFKDVMVAEDFLYDLKMKWLKENGYMETKLSYIENRHKFWDETGIEKEMLKMGYDGIVIKGREMVNYTPPDNVMFFEDELDLVNYWWDNIKDN